MPTSSIPQPEPEEQPVGVKTTFYNLVLQHDLDTPTLQLIATRAGVAERVVNDMFTSIAVHRTDAAKVLVAFSEYTQKTYTFEHVRVAVFPTFSELVKTHQLDLAALSTDSGVPYTVIDMMLADEPVPVQEARLVLQMASRRCECTYTLENVTVQVKDGGTTDGTDD